MVTRYNCQLLQYRHWDGRIIGQTLSHLWFSYPGCLFLEFGPLTEGEWFAGRRGQRRRGQRMGEWTLTTMDKYPDWTLSLGKRILATRDSSERVRGAALRRLVGRRLNSLEIDWATRATRLKFSLGLILETRTFYKPQLRAHHWMLRGPDSGTDDWPDVALRGI